MIRLKLTEKYYKDKHNSIYYRHWSKELTDIWHPILKFVDGDPITTYVSFSYRLYGIYIKFNDRTKTMTVELTGSKKNKQGKRSVYLEYYEPLIEEVIAVCTRLVQHGYAVYDEKETE